MKPQLFAYFLPQFHDCPLNSQWWGNGFTEWDNVRNAQPLFDGHDQPRVPLAGEFDLTSDGEISRQFRLAKSHGISSFAFYHYWSEGRRPLKAPLDLILSRPDIDVKFSLCWANHAWTRKWKNRRGSLDVLIDQTYEISETKREEHFAFLSRAFSDPRYTEVEGRPFFQIYIPEDLPDPHDFCESLRTHCAAVNGVEPHLSACVRRQMPNYNYLAAFDSVTLSQPILALTGTEDIFSGNAGLGTRDRILSLPFPLLRIVYALQDALFSRRRRVHDYEDTWKKLHAQTENIDLRGMPVIPSAFVDFDNTPRYGRGARITDGFTPQRFQSNLVKLLAQAQERSHGIVMINAWNEWGEGMYLQGDKKYPTQRLDAVKSAMAGLT